MNDIIASNIEKSLAEAVDKFQKQEEEKKMFLCRKLLKLEQSQSSATKQNTKSFFIMW